MEGTLNVAVKETEERKKTGLSSKRGEFLKTIARQGAKFIFCFLISRTSILFSLYPFSPAVMLASGGGFTAFFASLFGAVSCESFEGIFYVVTVFLLKIFLKNEKLDFANLLTSGVIVYASVITQSDFSPYDIIMCFLSVIISASSYYPLKTAYKSHFLKSKALKFTQKETYCSVFALFCLVSGIGTGFLWFADFGNIFKIYIITLCSYSMGIGVGATAGAVFGLLSGGGYKDASVSMAIYSFMGTAEGLFAKFSKAATVLGCLCAYTFTYVYLQDYLTMLAYKEVIIACLLFLVTPKKIIEDYKERFFKKENNVNMLSTVNSVLTRRLETLSASFFSLSEKINIMPAKNDSVVGLNADSMCDFVCEKVCRKCSLKHFCWDKQYNGTVDALMGAMNKISKKGECTEKDFGDYFKNHCTKIPEIIQCIKSFNDILKVNTVWKRKMAENSKAFKQQFIEISEIICDMKKSIETNKYYEAELSAEIYSAISYEGYLVKDVVVIKDATGAFFVKASLEHCYEKKNCSDTIKRIIEDVLGICVTKAEGECSDKICRLVFREGTVGMVKKRVYNISKNEDEPAGDSYIVKKISPNKYLAAICDGMGSGKNAKEVSETVTELICDMLSSGFSEEVTYRMINSFVLANLLGFGFTTVDFTVVDTKNMTAKIVKKGACPTYVKRNKKEVIAVQNNSMPAGLIFQKPFIKTLKISKGDIIVMASDGVFDALPDKDWVKNVLTKTQTQELNECVDLIYGITRSDNAKKDDDITLLGLCVV